jgi:hypothetical protein
MLLIQGPSSWNENTPSDDLCSCLCDLGINQAAFSRNAERFGEPLSQNARIDL